MAFSWALRGAVVETLEQRFLLSGEIWQTDPALSAIPYAPVTVQPSQGVEALSIQALPSSFSLRPTYVTGVRNQGNAGACWTFATYGSLESSILMAGGPATDFSENNLKNYHGFDWGPTAGGNSNISEAYLSRGSGPVSEADDPYHDWDDRVTPAPSYPRQYWVTEMYRYDTVSEMKTALTTRGALLSTMNWVDTSYRASDFTYYYTGGGSNHGITIVGWDDSKITAAATPGAWLVKNSWGSSWGDAGYFWLSYADGAGAKSGESFGGAVAASTYDNVYYWDTFGDVSEFSEPWAMNRFVAQRSEMLKAVGFFTQADNAGYAISIYDTFSGGSVSGLLGSSSGTSATAGWHTINLPSAINLTAGNDFYIVLSITNGGSTPQAMDCSRPGYSSASTAAANQSWFSSNGTSWTDLNSYNSTANFCIKAFTGSNYAPTGITLSASSIAEGQPTGTVVGTLGTSDPDVGNTFTYSLVSGAGSADNASFTIAGNQLKTAAVFDYELKSSYSIRLRSTDQGGLWYEKTFTITVTNAGEAPTDIALMGTSIAENRPAGTVIGAVSGSDPDPGQSATLTFSLPFGYGDNSQFEVVGNQLKAKGTLDYEWKSSYSIQIRATDTGGQSYDEGFTITVTNVNENPTDITLAGALVAENQPVGTVVSAVSGSDPDLAETFTYSLVSGAGSDDNASFTIAGGQLKTAAVFDFEARNSYLIRVRVTDMGGLWYEKALTISVTNVNENPTDIAMAGMSVAENQSAGTVIGTVSGNDPDAGQSGALAFSLPTGQADNSLFVFAGNQLRTKGAFDYETKSSYSVQVRATDTGGLSYDRAFTITVTDVNENPTDIALAGMSVAENQPAGTAVGAVSGNDPDMGQSATLTFGLVAGYGDNGLFELVGNQLRTKGALDYETRNSYSIELRAIDSGGLSYDETFTIAVVNVNENPTDIALASMSVAEHLPVGTVVGAVSGTDPDAGQSATLAFGLVAGYGDNSLFEVVGNQLRTKAEFNYESKDSYEIELRATDTGGLSYDKAFTITVTDVNENPTDIALAGMSVAENLPAGTVIGAVSGSDPDMGQSATVTFGLVAGYGDNGLFEIAGDQLTTASRFDYDGKNSYSILVRATDTGGLSYDEAFTVAITDDPYDLRGTFGLVNGKTVAASGLQDADGDLVTIKLSGGGTGQIYGFEKSFEDIILTGTTAKSVLTVSVKKNKYGGDGFVTVGNLSSGGLIKSVSGTAVVLSGQMLLNTLNQTAGKATVSLKLRQVNGAQIQVQGLPVSSISVAGDVSNSRIVTSGSIKTFSAGTLLNSEVLVGVARSFAGDFADVPDDFADTAAKLGSLKVTGRKLARGQAAPAYVMGSHISAPSVGTVSLLDLSAASGPTVHVLNDTGVLKVSQSKLVNETMFASGTWKTAGARPEIWDIVSRG